LGQSDEILFDWQWHLDEVIVKTNGNPLFLYIGPLIVIAMVDENIRIGFH